MMRRICGITTILSNGCIESAIYKTTSRKSPYELLFDNKTIARFDTEDKARMYQEAFHEGIASGFYKRGYVSQ